MTTQNNILPPLIQAGQLDPQTGCPIWLEGQTLCMIDQRLLPHTVAVLQTQDYEEAIVLITDMAVRGAGSIGVAGAFAVALAVFQAPEEDFETFVVQATQAIAQARPTAKNLMYAVDHMVQALEGLSAEQAKTEVGAVAQAFYEAEVQLTEAIAQAGVSLLPQDKAVMTHCNAGWLAYPGLGTALAPLFWAQAIGQSLKVYSGETRPRSQGAKLTCWELYQAGIDHALLPDTAAGHTMQQGKIGMVIVGADRIARNGDTANKIGTYQLAVLAQRHSIPFYVAAPSSTFDRECLAGSGIPIELRSEEEVTDVHGQAQAGVMGVRMASPGTHAENPAFDVTPAELITGIVTERGVIPADEASIVEFLDGR